jgi:hypothetical protein
MTDRLIVGVVLVDGLWGDETLTVVVDSDGDV